MNKYEQTIGELNKLCKKLDKKDLPKLIWKVWETEADRDIGNSIDCEFSPKLDFKTQFYDIEEVGEDYAAVEIWFQDGDESYTIWSTTIRDDGHPDFDYQGVDALKQYIEARQNKHNEK